MATPMPFGFSGPNTAAYLQYRLIDPEAYWDFEQEFTAQQTNTLIVAAPGANVSIWITDIVIAVNAADTISITDDTGAVKMKYYGSAQGDGLTKRFRCPIRVTANHGLQVSSSTGATFFIAVSGYLS